MRPGYVLTKRAESDLQGIADYIAEDSPVNAERVLVKLTEAFDSLANTPGIGRLREDLGNESVRIWVVYTFLVVYRPETKPLEILRVVSGYRDLVDFLQ